MNLVKNRFFKWSLGLVLIAGSVVAGQRVMNSFKEELGTYAAEGITEQIGKQRSSYRDPAAPGGGDSNFLWEPLHPTSVPLYATRSPVCLFTLSPFS
ncbi:MAG: hypothetical protein IPJ02_14610 [Chitinophagaceae bacterium]|nr:hypothetical protein [Chitinophagaceae bacterium]